MKLLENIEELGNSMHDAIRNLADEMFGRELSSEEVGDIVSNLKLSDILVLDTAYTQGDKDKVAKIFGFELNEYSMGRSATSAASERPKPGRREAPQAAAKEPAAKNTTQTNRNYSGGAQNAVTTKNIDSEDNPDAVMQDPESIEETGLDYNPARGGYNNNPTERVDGELLDQLTDYAEEQLDKIVGYVALDWWEIQDDLADVGVQDEEDVDKWVADIAKNHNESKDKNVIDMVEWLQRKAGIK